jgi:O-antigen/teichoic acid export membrane protein
VAGLVVAQSLASLAACAVYLGFLRTWEPGWWRFTVSAERRTALKSYAGTLMILILLDAVVWQRSGVFFLGLWSPAAEVAYYAMAFSLAQMAMRLIPGTLVGLLIPTMSKSFGAGDMTQVASIYRAAGRWMAVLAVPVAVGGGLLAPQLVEALYGPGFRPMAGPLALLLGSGAAVMVIGFPASSVLYALDGQAPLVRVGLVTALLNLALMVWLVPAYGAWGAALATGAAQLFSLAPGAWFAGRAMGGVWPDLARLPAIAAAAALMAVPVTALASHLPAIPALLAATPSGAVAYALGLWVFSGLPAVDRVRVAAVVARLPGI